MITDPSQLRASKASARAEALRRRAALSAAERLQAAHRVAGNLAEGIGALDAGTVVGFYWPIRDELDPRPAAERLASDGAATALPRMEGPERPLVFHRWQPGERLIGGGFGVQEPAPFAPRVRPEIVLVPLLAFDRQGRRLGYGKGFYDRTLADLRTAGRRVTALGVAFSIQEATDVPHDATDVPLDGIVTEREWIVTGLRP